MNVDSSASLDLSHSDRVPKDLDFEKEMPYQEWTVEKPPKP